MDYDTQLINLALDAGEIMLASGAETFRVQDTMQRILRFRQGKNRSSGNVYPSDGHLATRGKGPSLYGARRQKPRFEF